VTPSNTKAAEERRNSKLRPHGIWHTRNFSSELSHRPNCTELKVFYCLGYNSTFQAIFKSLLDDWNADWLATILTLKKFKTPTEEQTTKIALEFIHHGDLKRGIRLIEGHGRSDPDDPDVRQQRIEKYPGDSTTWCAPTTTWGAPDTEDVDFDMSILEEIKMATDKNKGVGPRGCHPAYIQALFEGRHQFDDAVENPNDDKLRNNGPAKS
jgi:hypothetical protein